MAEVLSIHGNDLQLELTFRAKVTTLPLSIPALPPICDSLREKLLNISLTFDTSESEHFYNHKFSETLKILHHAFIRPTKSEVLNPFSNEIETEDFSNIYHHVMAVGAVAKILASELLKANFINQSEHDQAILLAPMHDADKVIEILEYRAIRSGKLKAPASRYLKVMEKHLQKAKISPLGIKQAIYAGMIAGPEGLNTLLRANSHGQPYLSPNLKVEKIIRLADDMTCSRFGKHYLMTPLERLIASGFLTGSQIEFGSMFQNVTVYEDGFLDYAPPRTTSKKYIYAQWASLHVFTTNEICKEFFNALKLEKEIPSKDFVVGIKNHLQDRFIGLH